MSAKYIFYKPTDTPSVDDLTKGIQRNKKLSTDLNNARNNAKIPKPPTVKLSKVADEFDKPYMQIRKSLIEKLNQYELEQAGNYDDPEVNAKIEDMKRQIKDFAKFTIGEAETYSTLVKASKNPKDADGNPEYDVSSLKRMPKRLTQDDVTKAISNAGEGGDISYLFGGASPMKDVNGNYIFDEDGLLLDEDANKIEGFNQDGSQMTTDEFVFENRRNYSNNLNPELFDFGERGIEFNGVDVEDVTELNFNENEVMSAPENIDFITGVTKAVKVQSGGYNMDTGKLNAEGERAARNQIRSLITVKPSGAYPDKNSNSALQEIAFMYLENIQGIGDPTDESIQELLSNPKDVGLGGQSFNDYAENVLYDRWKEGKGYKPSRGMNINIAGGGKSKDFFFGNQVNDDSRDLQNYTILNENGAAVGVESKAYSEAVLNNVKTQQTFAIRQGVIFPQAIAGLDKIQDRTFRVITDNVRIQAIDKSTGQIATKEQIQSGDPNVVFEPYALAKATSNTPMSSSEYLKLLQDVPTEQQDSFKKLQDLLTKSDKTAEILVPLNQMFTSKELEQFKALQEKTEQLNKEYKAGASKNTEVDREQEVNNLRTEYNY